MNQSPKVLIIGAGWIGRQVGLRMAICGLHVTLADKSSEVLHSAQEWMLDSSQEYLEQILASPTQKQSPAAAQLWQERISFGQSAHEPAEAMDVVLECVSEQVSLKRRVLREFSKQYPKPTIIASNSSYFTPSTLAGFVESPERFAHWHFHVPLFRASIADVCGHPQTDPAVLDKLVQLSEQIDQYPLRLRHEQSGYVFNWLLQSLLRSALELAARDVADKPEIDRAWRAVSGMALGPFEMMDHIGLDVIEQCLANARWDNSAGESIENLLAILRGPISRGDLGLKTGRGFYDHE